MGGLSGPGVPNLIGLSEGHGGEGPASAPPGIGYAPSGVQAAQAVKQVLEGLRQGYQRKALKQYDQAQTQYNMAVTALQNSQKQIDALKSAGVSPQDPAFQAAVEAMTKQQAESTKAWTALNDMVTGKGAKGAGGGWGEQGGVKGVVGHLLNRIMPNPFSPLNEPAWGELGHLSKHAAGQIGQAVTGATPPSPAPPGAGFSGATGPADTGTIPAAPVVNA